MAPNRFPEHKDLDVWAFIRPAREVGGDFYDFFFINERLFAFVVADVSGKGVPAALLMAVAITLLKSNSQDTQSTAKIVQRTNNELSVNNKDCMFLTAFFGIIDTKTGELTYTGDMPFSGQMIASFHTEATGLTEAVYRFAISINQATPVFATAPYALLSIKDVGDGVVVLSPVELVQGDDVRIMIAGDGFSDNLVVAEGSILIS